MSLFVNNSVMDEIIKFYSDGCGGCKAMQPIMEQLEKEYPAIKFSEVNTDDEPDKVTQFGITSLPTLVFIKDGKELAKLSGLKPKILVVKKIAEVF